MIRVYKQHMNKLGICTLVHNDVMTLISKPSLVNLQAFYTDKTLKTETGYHYRKKLLYVLS